MTVYVKPFTKYNLSSIFICLQGCKRITGVEAWR